MQESRPLTFGTKQEAREFVRTHTPKSLPVMGLYKNLSQVLDAQSGQWAAYKAMASEPPLEGILPARMDWYFPAVQNKTLSFSKSKNWKRSVLGFQEPENGVQIEIGQLDGFLVPGLVFSKKGERIGRGQGFYDQVLNQTKALKVGVCYSYQVFEQLPVEAHDINMDVLITDDEILWLKR